MGFESINSAINLVLPEVVLIATTCVMFLAAPFLVAENGAAAPGIRHRWGALALLAISVAGWFWMNSGLVPINDGPFRLDGLSYYIRGTTLVFGAVISLMLWSQVDDSKAAECQALLLAILAGVNFTVAANDLVVLFLGLELVSIPTYVLLALPRRDRESQEATIKYFLLSAFSSAVVLYGFALLYGATGTTHFVGIAQAIGGNHSGEFSKLLPLSVALIVAGLGFRVTAVPFHFYAPDVFQGSPAFAAGMLSLIPKIVGFAALVRVLGISVADTAFDMNLDSLASIVKPLLAMLAVVTMLLGNLMALRQTNIHRLMAYSSVAHAGYMLVGLTIGDRGQIATGVSAMLFYLVAYGVMTLGVFAVLCAISPSDRPIKDLHDLNGISRHHSAAALMLAVFLFSLAGLPPSGGFLGKMNLFLAAWSEGTMLGKYLAYIMAFNAMVSAVYYLRIVAAVYLKPGTGPTTMHMSAPAMVASVFCMVATFAMFVSPQAIWDRARMKDPSAVVVVSPTEVKSSMSEAIDGLPAESPASLEETLPSSSLPQNIPGGISVPGERAGSTPSASVESGPPDSRSESTATTPESSAP